MISHPFTGTPSNGVYKLVAAAMGINLKMQFRLQDAAMGIIMRAAGSTAGWTTGSGLEGPDYSMQNAPKDIQGPIFSKLPRRRMRVAFICNVWPPFYSSH